MIRFIYYIGMMTGSTMAGIDKAAIGFSKQTVAIGFDLLVWRCKTWQNWSQCFKLLLTNISPSEMEANTN